MTQTEIDGLDAAALAELHRLARCRPRSGRQAAAKAAAIRTLERIGRRRGGRPMPAGWHPQPGSAWEELDRWDPPEVREFWWASLHEQR